MKLLILLLVMSKMLWAQPVDEQACYQYTHAAYMSCEKAWDYRSYESCSTKGSFASSGSFYLPDGKYYSGPSYFYENHNSAGLYYRPLPRLAPTGKVEFMFERYARVPPNWFPDSFMLKDVLRTCPQDRQEKVTVPAGTFDTCKFVLDNPKGREQAVIWVGDVTLGVVKNQFFFCGNLVSESLLK